MILAVSGGEPAGIGPEVAVAAWAAVRDEVRLLWIGDPGHLPPGTPWQAVTNAAEAATVTAGALPVLAVPAGPAPVPGRADPGLAAGVVAAIRAGAELALTGQVAGLVTAPINKAVLAAGAGFAFPGHTEFLAHLAGGVPMVMMLVGGGLRAVPATIHIPLAEVPRALTPAVLEQAIRVTRAGLIRDFGLAAPRLAVAGLNPHAGEAGRMGTEELDWMAPLLDRLRAEGMALLGPLPADTMFHPAARARYDAAICAYHDQALIPVKTLDFAGGVNVTLGLPFIRTSPDHGTAFDIAGRGLADPASMIAAIRLAAGMAAVRGRA
jgi:4-hydroxythreonine-4-phosphate dehydrogenase